MPSAVHFATCPSSTRNGATGIKADNAQKAIQSAIDACAKAGGDPATRISAEPGRSIVASAGITLYTVGTVKHLPGIRTYVSVDGGMSDNPRPVLYGSGYEAFLPRATDAERSPGEFLGRDDHADVL